MPPTDFSRILPDHLDDQKRFDLVSHRHRNALAWIPQAWIPLGIIVSNPDHLSGISYDQWLEADVFFEVQAKILRDTLEVGSDTMPVMPLNHLGDVLVPTMLGADLFHPSEMAGSLQDTGATPLPILSDIREIDSLIKPDMNAGLMPEIVEMIRLWRSWAPEWVYIVTPFPLGPFSLAEELRGSGLFLDLVDDPDRCRKLLEICANLQIQTEQHLRAAIADSDGPPLSNFGVHSLGRRIGDDTIINLSPDHLREFVIPSVEIISRALGPTTLHFCTLEEHRADHLFDPLAESSLISTASSQFAFEYYESHVDELRGRLSVESLYGDAYAYIDKKYGSFHDWAFEFVPKYKDESGMVLYFQVSSVDEGSELWDTWIEAHNQ